MLTTNCLKSNRNTLSNDKPKFTVSIASTEQDILDCQQLRYKVFAEELGANLESSRYNIDIDYFDDYCKHLLVKDIQTGDTVACTRAMNSLDAKIANGFYSETEFDLHNILALKSELLEVGRTCVSADYRNTNAINYLWQGVASMMIINKTNYLIGCISIPLTDKGRYLESIMKQIRKNHFAPKNLQVTPLIPVKPTVTSQSLQAVYPSLLKRYINIGAMVCGEPCFDADFGVANIFVIVDRDRISRRYQRHFLKSA